MIIIDIIGERTIKSSSNNRITDRTI